MQNEEAWKKGNEYAGKICRFGGFVFLSFFPFSFLGRRFQRPAVDRLFFQCCGVDLLGTFSPIPHPESGRSSLFLFENCWDVSLMSYSLNTTKAAVMLKFHYSGLCSKTRQGNRPVGKFRQACFIKSIDAYFIFPDTATSPGRVPGLPYRRAPWPR